MFFYYKKDYVPIYCQQVKFIIYSNDVKKPLKYLEKATNNTALVLKLHHIKLIIPCTVNRISFKHQLKVGKVNHLPECPCCLLDPWIIQHFLCNEQCIKYVCELSPASHTLLK